MEKLIRYLKEDMMVYFATAIALAVTVVLYPTLPDIVPIHWNAAGEPDGFAAKHWAAWMMPITAVGTHLFTVVMMVWDPRRKYLESSSAMSILRAVTPLFLLAVHGVMVMNWRGANIDLNTSIFFLTGLLLMVCGNYVGKLPQNYTAGVRLPWTLDDPVVWKKTNRLTARVLFFGGGLLALGGFVPTHLVIPFVFCLTAIMVVLPIGAALYYWQARGTG